MQWIDECTGIPLGIHGFGYKYVCVYIDVCICVYIYISLVVWCIHCFSFDTWNYVWNKYKKGCGTSHSVVVPPFEHFLW